MLIVGLSGTGKTTTTFTSQLGSRPAQDDFVALMPGGRVYTTENGCFAKTFGLDPRYEPAIYHATTQPDAYLENVSVDAAGQVDFFDTSYTRNGRTTWPFSYVDPWPGNEVPPADFLLILNRNENIVPGVARLDRTQAAAYFMLGETTGTSAGGKDEEGKFLRVPGTNPFFPRDMADMGNRMLELLDTKPMQVFVLNTGRVGGAGRGHLQEGHHPVLLGHGRGHRVRHHRVGSGPGLRLRDSVTVRGIDDLEILQPRRLYERQGRLAEYDGRGRADQAGAARLPGLLPRPGRVDRQEHRLAARPRAMGRARRARRGAVFWGTDVSVPLWGNYVALMDRSCLWPRWPAATGRATHTRSRWS